MPTIQSMDLPIPKDWQEFESIVRDALINRWRSPSLTKIGRSGQKQHGVDIYGPDYLGRPVGIQCKRFKGQLKLKVVSTEIKNAENFSGHLSTLFIATTAEHDSQLQEQVRIISEERSKQGKFAVGILFWDEIVAGLVLNSATVQAHYPQIVVQPTAEINRERKLAALEFGYFGADLWEYVTLMYGEFGWLSNADPDELIANLRVLAHRAQQLLAPDDATPIIESLTEIREGCLSKKNQESDWHPVETHANRASKRIARASSLLALDESNVLDVGIQLGRIYHHYDDVPKKELRNQIKEKVQLVLSTTSITIIEKVFTEAETFAFGSKWVTSIYSLLNRELRKR